jgi:hypothetical protein
VTKRKPLQWDTVGRILIPNCDTCMDLYTQPGFREAVYSTAIEHPGDPADLARRTLDAWHAARHQDRT